MLYDICMIFVKRFIIRIATSHRAHGLKNEEVTFKAIPLFLLGEINEEASEKKKCRNSECAGNMCCRPRLQIRRWLGASSEVL